MVGQEEDEIGLSHVDMFLVRDPSFPCRCREDEYRIWMVATFHNENSSFEENKSAISYQFRKVRVSEMSPFLSSMHVHFLTK